MSTSWKERNEVRRKFWKSHIKHWSESSISQLEYCRQNDLIPHQFTYWKTKFKNQNLPVEFIQVMPEPMNIDLANLKLNISQGLQIEIPDGFTSTTLERVLTTLKVL
ncbi:MAG: IS66 family insertion sequence element accessory protein TnpB [Desulfobacteraceae bacterium]|nr:IS66 family insertion sequence element accessory protein TnpB [Desulfobacteraceae bacterium]